MSSAIRQGRVPVAVLISGRGSNMMALVEAARAVDYPAEIVTVISNRPDAAGLEWARAQGIATAVVDHATFANRAEFDAKLHKTLVAHGAELVACAGFMRIMTEDFVSQWEGRMINIHPSLLPSFKGLHPQARALEAGVRIAGCTVHYVISEVDAGPIIVQGAVSVLPQDTAQSLAARIVKVEHRIYPLALKLVAGGDASLINGRVALKTNGNTHTAFTNLAWFHTTD
ncbi:MAG: phosphoribosylglycinamide formyltransferase [Pseudomonadota bacterium]